MFPQYLICTLINMIVVFCHDAIFDKEKGLTVLDVIQIVFIIMLGPIGSLILMYVLHDDIGNLVNKVLNYQLVKAIDNVPQNKLKTNDVISGSDKLPPPLSQKPD